MRYRQTLLTEAELNDIYHKFYETAFAEDDFYETVKADPTYDPARPQKMGKYGKWLLTNVKLKKLKMEDLYKATESLKAFDKYRNMLDIKDITKYKTPDDLYQAVKRYIGSDIAVSNRDRKHAGAEHVYEDSRWLIIIPRTHEASVYYGRGTRWCTASKDSDRYFKDYSSNGNLYINIRKSDGAKFQFHFPSRSFMDAEDIPITGIIADKIGLSPGAVEFYDNLDDGNDWLYVLTQEEQRDEDDEYRAEVLLENDRVSVAYRETEYEIDIYYSDGSSYTLSTYTGTIYDDSTQMQIRDVPASEYLTPDVIKLIRDYLNNDEFYRIVLGLYFISDIRDMYYPVGDNYVLCHLEDNDETSLYFCDADTFKTEMIIDFKEDDMTLVDAPDRSELANAVFLKLEDDDGLQNVYFIEKEMFVFDSGFDSVHTQRREKCALGMTGRPGEPVTLWIDGKSREIPVPDGEIAVNAEYNMMTGCVIVNAGDDILSDSKNRQLRLYMYSLETESYVSDEPYSNMYMVTERDDSPGMKRIGYALADLSEKSIKLGDFKYNIRNRDEYMLDKMYNKYGHIVLLDPTSDAPVVLRDKTYARSEYMKKIGAYDLCLKVFRQRGLIDESAAWRPDGRERKGICRKVFYAVSVIENSGTDDVIRALDENISYDLMTRGELTEAVMSTVSYLRNRNVRFDRRKVVAWLSEKKSGLPVD